MLVTHSQVLLFFIFEPSVNVNVFLILFIYFGLALRYGILVPWPRVELIFPTDGSKGVLITGQYAKEVLPGTFTFRYLQVVPEFFILTSG